MDADAARVVQASGTAVGKKTVSKKCGFCNEAVDFFSPQIERRLPQMHADERR
jgi:hypothetical protein